MYLYFEYFNHVKIYSILLKYLLYILIFSGIIYGLVLNSGGPKHAFQVSNNKELQLFETAESKYHTDLINKLKNDLANANEKIELLENKMQGFEERIKKPYPNVKYLNYRSKKRILVS